MDCTDPLVIFTALLSYLGGLGILFVILGFISDVLLPRLMRGLD